MKEIQVSTIIPIFKGLQYIEKQKYQIEKAAEQIDGRLDLIFVNDDPDEPINVEMNSDVINITVLQTDTNRGIQGARVYGLKHARGEFIHFLDQDDEISFNFYASQLTGIGDHDMIYCRLYNGNRESYTSNQMFETVMHRENILRVCPLRSPGQALIRREAISDIWKSNIVEPMGSDDYMLYLLMHAEGKSFTCNQKLLFRHVINGNNLSSDVLRGYEADKKMIAVLLDNNVFSPEDIELAKEIPERNLRRRYEHQRKDQIVLNLLSDILRAEAGGNTLDRFFSKNGIMRLAVYGAGVFGRAIKNILEKEETEVSFFIDKNAKYLHESVPVYEPEKAPADVDAILVSLITHEDEVREELKKKYNVPIYTIKEIVAEISIESNPLI